MNIKIPTANLQIMKLSEFLTFRNDYVTISDDVEYRLVTVKLHGKGIVPREKLLGSQIKTKKQQVILHNQFLVAEIDAKVGAFGVVPKYLEGAIVSGHYFLYDIDSEKVLPEFVECFVASGFLTEKIQEYVQGSLNYAAIRPSNILEIEMVVPVEKDDQKKVMNQLIEIRRIHQAAEQQLEAIIALEKSLMRQTFKVQNNE
jgi:type I restriction enzyme S subunit